MKENKHSKTAVFINTDKLLKTFTGCKIHYEILLRDVRDTPLCDKVCE